VWALRCNYEREGGETLRNGAIRDTMQTPARDITLHNKNFHIFGLSSVAVTVMNLDHGDERREILCGVTTTE